MTRTALRPALCTAFVRSLPRRGLHRVHIKDGTSSKAHAHRVAERTASAVLGDIAYHATNPDYECGTDEAECLLLTQEIETELMKRYEIGECCFSSTSRNPLLWSHYGDQHKGVCIGYGMNRRPAPKLQQVEYGGARCINLNPSKN